MSGQAKPNEIVTVVDNETGKEVTGRLVSYLPNKLVLQVEFDAGKVHFKDK